MVCVNGPDENDYRYLFSNVYYCNTFTTRSAIDCRWEQPSPALIIVSIDFFPYYFLISTKRFKRSTSVTNYALLYFHLHSSRFWHSKQNNKILQTHIHKKTITLHCFFIVDRLSSIVYRKTQKKSRKSSSRELFSVYRRYALPGCERKCVKPQ